MSKNATVLDYIKEIRQRLNRINGVILADITDIVSKFEKYDWYERLWSFEALPILIKRSAMDDNDKEALILLVNAAKDVNDKTANDKLVETTTEVSEIVVTDAKKIRSYNPDDMSDQFQKILH